MSSADPKARTGTPLTTTRDDDGTVLGLRDRIRTAILGGELPPGTVMSQVRLAAQFGVSRTPLREALRMLQEDGLLVIEPNRRAKVAGFDSDDLELVYASRILLSALATAITVPRLTSEDLAAMRCRLRSVELCAEADDTVGWRTADLALHQAHCMYAPASVQRELWTLFERATLYRMLRLRDQPHRQAVLHADHERIVVACEAHDKAAAVAAVARHLSRIALSLLAYTAPERDPVTIRTALQVALGDAG